MVIELQVAMEGYLLVLDSEPDLVCAAFVDEERREELRVKAAAALTEEP